MQVTLMTNFLGAKQGVAEDKFMNELTQTIKTVNAVAPFTLSVICAKNKEFYLKHPKMVQRLPKEERAYWYWFLKNH